MDGGYLRVRFAMWFPVAAGKFVPRPDITASAWKQASTAEITSLQTGEVVEEVSDVRFANTQTATQIKAALVSQYASRKAYLDALPFVGQYYGIFYDGTAWNV
jgi:hypothetical protein